MASLSQSKGSIGSSARSSAEDRDPGRWVARPKAALLIRFLVASVPIAMSVIALHTVTRLVSRPSSLAGSAVWFTGAVAVAFVVMRIVDRLARRLLPLAALFRFSTVFPDQAPQRFGVALKNGTTRQLESRLAALREDPEAIDVATGAERLIGLVGMVGQHDRLTRGHSERVRAYSDLIGEELGLGEHDRQMLHWAALLHDIGKLDVPAEILTKASKPTNTEWDRIRQHPAAATDLIAPLVPWLGDWTRAATDHHERWDGTGYPSGLAGEEISIAGRIVAVADAYDVMTAARSYKKPIAPEKARAELAACAGTQFDPVVVRAFLNVGIGRVRAATGSVAWLSQFPSLAQSVSTVATTAGTAATVTAITAISVASGVGATQATSASADVALEAATTTTAPLAATTTIRADDRLVDDPPTSTTPPSTTTSSSVVLAAEPTAVSPGEVAVTVPATTSSVPGPATTTTTIPTATTAAPVTTVAPTPTTVIATTTAVPTTTVIATTTTASSGEILTGTSAGGQATFSFTSTLVDVISITPTVGFTETINVISPTHVQVTFSNGIDVTKIKARWKSGAPLIEVIVV